MKSSRNRITFLLAGFAVAMFAGVLILLFGPGPGDNSAGDRDANLRDLALAPDDPTLGRETEVKPDGLHSVNLEELLDDYLTWAQYPPDSRPLKPEHVDVLEHYWVNIPAQTMVVTRDDGTIENTGFECRLQPARHSVTENEIMTIALYCQEAESERLSTIRIRSKTLTLSAADRNRALPAEQFTVNDEGKHGDERAGDGIYTFQFKPGRDDWGDVYLETGFEIQGRPAGEVHTLRTHFFSSPTAPAKFTGNFREGVRDGSLVISVELLVEQPGRYTSEANLFKTGATGDDPDGAANIKTIAAKPANYSQDENESDELPIGFARADARLSRGLQWVDLLYFGKVLHDQNQPGPYVLRGLRGVQDTGPIDPDRLDASPEEVTAYLATIRQDRPARKQLPYWPGGYVTRPYDLSEFSRAEYDSPVKQERVARLKAMIAGEQE